MMLWYFGLMLIGSAFIVGAWTAQLFKYRKPFTYWNAALVLAIGFDMQSIGMTLQAGVRIGDLFTNGGRFLPNAPLVYWTGGALVLLAKTAFVWVAVMRVGHNYAKKTWLTYWVCVTAWSVFAILRV